MNLEDLCESKISYIKLLLSESKDLGLDGLVIEH